PFIDPTSLPIAQVSVLFDRLRAMGIRRLGLAGGEPMMRPDLGEIVALAKQQRFFVSVNSNLTLYRRHPERLAAADLGFTSPHGDAAAHAAAPRGRPPHGGRHPIPDLGARGTAALAPP